MLENRYFYNEDGQLIDTNTGEIINQSELIKAHKDYLYNEHSKIHTQFIELTGKGIDVRLVKDRKGNEYHSYNVKEGFHFVKVFKVDVREMLESSEMSIISCGFIYRCLAYLHFPTNSIVIDGETPTNEKLCERFKIGKTKLYEVFKELEKFEVIKRKKVNGQTIIYLNPFLHSSGLVNIETYNMFRDSCYNPSK